MDTYRNYKQKIDGLTDVRETVKTIEKIAASELHVVRTKQLQLRSYVDEVARVLARIEILQKSATNDSCVRHSHARNLVLVCGGDRGLVGDMWEHLYSHVRDQQLDADFWLYGTQVAGVWEAIPNVQIKKFTDRIPTESEVRTLSGELQTLCATQQYTRVSVALPTLTSSTTYTPELLQLWPFSVPVRTAQTHTDTGWPIIEGSVQALRRRLLDLYLEAALLSHFLTAAEAEFSIRTIFMEEAERKTEDLTHDLSLAYARDRRAVETQKQLARFSARTRCNICI